MSRFIMVVFASAECGDDEPQTHADVPSLTLGRDKGGASVSAAQSAKVFVIRRIAIVRQIIV